MPAVHHRAEIHRHKVPGFHRLVRRHAVRQGGIGARHHDEIKSDPLRSLPADKEFQLQSNLPFRPARTDIVEYFLKAIGGQRLGFPDTTQLIRGFDQSKRLQPVVQLVPILDIPRQGLPQLPPFPQGHLPRFHQQPPDAVLFHQFPQGVRQALIAQAFHGTDLPARRLDIAEIRQEIRGVRQNENTAVAGGKAGQIPAVMRRGNQCGAAAVRKPGREAFPIRCHHIPPSSARRQPISRSLGGFYSSSRSAWSASV